MIQNVGNLWRVRLDAAKLTGNWKIKIISSQAYSLKVTGQMDGALGSSRPSFVKVWLLFVG